MGIDVRTIDPTDRESLHAFWAAGEAAESDSAMNTWPTWEVAQVGWTAVRDDRDTRFVVGLCDGTVVGGAKVDLPLSDNPHLAMLSLVVDPAHGGRGVGSAVLAEVERQVLAAGRSTLLAWTVQPPGSTSAGPRFAASSGFAVANRNEAKAADLEATADRWSALAAEAEQRMAGYRLEVWEGATPENRVADVCRLFSALFAEIPLGDIDMDPQAWDATRLREAEQRRDEMGLRSLVVVAVSPDDEAVGYSECVHEAARPDPADLTSTLVLPDHRGHRLGLALKVRLHTELQQRFPACRRIVTTNATSNEAMNRVNRQLGYEVVEEVLEVQKRLA